MIVIHFQAALLSLSVYFDPIIQLFLIRARDPLSYNERLGEGLQESGRRRGGAIHNQLRNYLIEPSSVGEIASTISSGFASMTPIGFEDLHPRAASAVIGPGKMERYIVFELCILSTILLLCYVSLFSLYNIKAVVIFFIINVLPICSYPFSTVNACFYQRLLNNDCCLLFLQLMLFSACFLTFEQSIVSCHC